MMLKYLRSKIHPIGILSVYLFCGCFGGKIVNLGYLFFLGFLILLVSQDNLWE